MKKFINWVATNYLIFIFLISGAAVFGSLYFSEIQNLTPCLLCWYQRIFTYPIFIISAVSLAFNQIASKKVLLALAVPSALIALYQYITQLFPIPNQFVVCSGGVDCSAIDWSILGFVTIPFLSLLASTLIIVAIFINYIVLRSKKVN